MKQRPVKKALYIQSNLPVHCNLIAFGVSAKLLGIFWFLINSRNQSSNITRKKHSMGNILSITW